jgi:hypothetical protein
MNGDWTFERGREVAQVTTRSTGDVNVTDVSLRIRSLHHFFLSNLINLNAVRHRLRLAQWLISLLDRQALCEARIEQRFFPFY